MSLIVKAGAQSVSCIVYAWDTTTNGPKTALAYNTSGLAAYYTRAGEAAAQITLATQTVAGGYSEGGFVKIDDTNSPGDYRLDIPNDALAAGATEVVISLTLSGALIGHKFITIDQITATAATNITNAVTGSAGTTLTLDQLRINSSAAGGAIDIDNSGGPAIAANGTTFGLQAVASGGPGISTSGTTRGLYAVASAGPGVEASGTTYGISVAASAGPGLSAVGGTNGSGIVATGAGTGAGLVATGGGTNGDGIKGVGGATNGNGFYASGAGIGSGLSVAGGVGGAGLFASGAGGGILALGVGNTGFSTIGTTGWSVTGSTGAGLAILGTTYGIQATASAGPGLYAAGGTNGSGIVAVKAGTGHDILLNGDGKIYDNIAGADVSANLVAGTIKTTSFTAGAIDAAAIANGAIDAATFAAGAIDAAAIADNAIDNATFASDVGSTVYASNKISLATNKALVNYPITKPTGSNASTAMVAGSTNVSTIIILLDPTTGLPKTGYLAADLSLSYCKPGSAAVSQAASDLSAITDAWAAGGVKENSSIAYGTYRIDWPNAAFTPGTNKSVTLIVQDTSNNLLGRIDVSLASEINYAFI